MIERVPGPHDLQIGVEDHDHVADHVERAGTLDVRQNLLDVAEDERPSASEGPRVVVESADRPLSQRGELFVDPGDVGLLDRHPDEIEAAHHVVGTVSPRHVNSEEGPVRRRLREVGDIGRSEPQQVPVQVRRDRRKAQGRLEQDPLRIRIRGRRLLDHGRHRKAGWDIAGLEGDRLPHDGAAAAVHVETGRAGGIGPQAREIEVQALSGHARLVGGVLQGAVGRLELNPRLACLAGRTAEEEDERMGGRTDDGRAAALDAAGQSNRGHGGRGLQAVLIPDRHLHLVHTLVDRGPVERAQGAVVADRAKAAAGLAGAEAVPGAG